jgi:hypothetical protein
MNVAQGWVSALNGSTGLAIRYAPPGVLQKDMTTSPVVRRSLYWSLWANLHVLGRNPPGISSIRG